MSLKKKTIISISWVGALRGASRVLSVGRTIILARLLTPKQFGVFGISALVLGFLEMLTETGINVVLVQDKSKNTLEKFVSTAWLISIVRGLIIGLFIVILAPIISTYFDEPESLVLIRLIAIVPIVRGFINPSIARFQKHFEFYQEFWFRGATVLFDFSIAFIVTWITRSPVGLVYGLIASAALETLLSWILIRPLPHLSFSLEKAKAIISGGKWITLSGVTNYFANKISDVSIGKILSTSSLGGFQTLYKLIITPIDELNEVVNRVFFPTYVAIHTRKTKVKKAFIRHLTLNASLSSVFAIFAIVLGPSLVALFLGNEWIQITEFIIPMSLLAVAIAITAPTNPLLLAFNQQKILTLTSIIKLTLVAVTVVPFTSTFGVDGAIYSVLISQCAIIPVRYSASLKIFSNPSAN